MRTLLVYYSFTGNNAKLAARLGELLGCDVVKLQEKRKRTGISILLDLVFKRRSALMDYSVDVSTYDNVVIAGPVWAGKLATPLQTFLELEKKKLKRYAVLSLCSGNSGQRAKIREYLNATVKKAPAMVEELWIDDLLPAAQKGKIKFTTSYRVSEQDWQVFDPKLLEWVKVLTGKVAEVPA